jgi:hypothetical protein
LDLMDILLQHQALLENKHRSIRINPNILNNDSLFTVIRD